MPIRTTVDSWPKYRPDYWAGERGGRPLPTRPTLPKRGDKGPREPEDRMVKVFHTHDSAVRYAKLFSVPIHTKYIVNKYDDLVKVFIVEPVSAEIAK